MQAKILLYCWFMLLSFGLVIPAHAADNSHDGVMRVLFVGNSFSDGLTKPLRSVTKRFGDKVFLSFITPGHQTLLGHVMNENVSYTIASGQWDYVVLQEQSKIPALEGAYRDMFFLNVKTFSERIRQAGAEPVLYLTWANYEGDKLNPKENPDFHTMQQHVSAAYRQAAKDNKALLVPVGEVWEQIRGLDYAFWQRLYGKDHYHASELGNFLNAYLFYCFLFGGKSDSVSKPDHVSSQDFALLKQQVELKIKQSQ